MRRGSIGRSRARAAALALALLAACAPERPPAAPANVLLITVDTLRPDHLSCYGYERATSPAIDALAANGVRFTHAQSPRAKTTPAVASLLTGLYPHDHGVRDFAMPLAASVPTLAEALRARGWRTGAIVGNWVLRDEQSGLARGFDTWIEELPEVRGVPPDDVPERTADSLTDEALAWLGLDAGAPGGAAGGEPSDSPWFLWLHYMDPHGQYLPPEEHAVFRSTTPAPIDDAEREGERSVIVATYNVPAEAWLPDGRIDAARVIDRYDGEIRFVDAEIGRLVEALRAAGALERTWIVLTADHGESLGELRYWFEHGVYAHEATCRVPLVVHPPLAMRERPAGEVRGADVALADLAPTLLELVGLAPDALGGDRAAAGRSRARLIAADDDALHPVFCEKVDASAHERAVQTKAVRAGDWKLVRRWVGAGAAAGAGEPSLRLLGEELYDLARDPAETRDLSAAPPPDAPLAALRQALARFTRADAGLARIDEELRARREAVDPETDARLRALGYR